MQRSAAVAVIAGLVVAVIAGFAGAVIAGLAVAGFGSIRGEVGYRRLVAGLRL